MTRGLHSHFPVSFSHMLFKDPPASQPQSEQWQESHLYLKNCPVESTIFSLHRYHYRPQRSWGKVMFLQVCVILFSGGSTWPGTPPGTRCTSRGQVHPSDQVHPPWDQVHPPVHPLDQVHPRDQVHPPPQDQVPGTPPGGTACMLGDTVYARAVRILLECNLVSPCSLPRHPNTLWSCRS